MVYEYKCLKCGKNHQQEHKLTAKPAKCPKCGAKRLEKLLFATQFTLKGGGVGWESTGYSSSTVDKKAEKRFKDATE